MPTLSDNRQQFVINADSVFLNNNNDKHNSHILIQTKGEVNENDIEFATCNVKVVDGDFSTKRIKDLAGNAVMDINTNAIDFKNTPISNLNLGTGTVTASTVASSNGYASLDLELDAHLALINGKVSQNGHTANKIFVSSNGGALTTSGNCTPSDLAKLATNGAVDLNTAKTSFPGFGTTAGTSLEGDTTTISGAQASAITANTAKVSFPGFGSSAGTALEGDTTTISVSQASAITANTAKTSFPGFGTSAGTALEGDTTTISGAQASAITANTAKTSFPGFGTSAGTALEGDTTTISGAQASAITANTAKTSFPGFGTSAGTALEGNTTTISSSQATAISTNTSNISTNTSNISTNTTDITAVNAGRVANQNAIAINTGNISSNTTKTNQITVANSVNLNTETHNNVSLFAGNVGGISYVNNKCGDLTLKGGYDGTYDSGKISLFTDNTERMLIDTNGRVGIGEDSPDMKLHIKVNGNDGVKIESTNASGPGYMYIQRNTDGKSYVLNQSNHPLILGANNNTNQLYLKENGYVGIGTNTPSRPFHVYKSGSQEPLARFQSSNGDCSIRVEGPGGEVYLEIANTGSTGSSSSSWGIGTNDDNKLHFAYGSNSTMNKTDKMVILNNGYVGIGTTSPTHPLQVATSVYRGDFGSNAATYWADNSSGTWNDDGNGTSNNPMSIKANQGILSMYGFWTQSDKRIKKDIVEIEDSQSLKILRDISCCSYKYIDTLGRGNLTQIGFIAQQVNEHLPNAISIQKIIIPNEMRKLNNTTWDGTKMSSSDLQDVSGIKYRFYVSNDISGNEKMVELVGDEDNCFTFEEKWENVFCYGKEVNDFHTLDKQKLFALNFSATQELDRQVTQLTQENQQLKARLDALEEIVSKKSEIP